MDDDNAICGRSIFINTTESDTTESASMIAKEIHNSHPVGPVPTSLIGPVVHPFACAIGARRPQPTSVPKNIETAVLGPMINP